MTAFYFQLLRKQSQRKVLLYQISISQVITLCIMTLMTTIYITRGLLFKQACVQKLDGLRYAIINYVN